MKYSRTFEASITNTAFTPTIIIICPCPELIEAEIKTLCESLCSFRIEVHHGAISPFIKGARGGFPAGFRKYEEKVCMGRSISAVKCSSSGTFGGWVTDIHTKKKFGITAGHVAMGNQKGRFESFPQIVVDVPLVQPSEEDFMVLLAEAKENADKKRAASANCGFQHPKLEQARVAAEEEVHRLSSLKESRALGHVVKAFVGVQQGIGAEPRTHWKDYALIEVVPGKSASDMN